MMLRSRALCFTLLVAACEPEVVDTPWGPCDCDVSEEIPRYLGDEATGAAFDAGLLDAMTDIDGPYCPDCILMIQAEFDGGASGWGYMDVLPQRILQPHAYPSSMHWDAIPDDAWQDLRNAMLAPGVEWRGQWWYDCAGAEDGHPYRLNLWLPGEQDGRYRVSGLRFGVRCIYPDIRAGDDGTEWFPAMEEMWTVLEAMVQVYYATVPDEKPDPDGPFAYLFEEDR